MKSREWQDFLHGAHSRAFFGVQGEPCDVAGALDRRRTREPGLTAGENVSVIIAISTPLTRLIRGNGLLKNAAKQLSFTDLGRVTGAGIGWLRLKHLIQPT
jgi:hypothetical protein